MFFSLFSLPNCLIFSFLGNDWRACHLFFSSINSAWGVRACCQGMWSSGRHYRSRDGHHADWRDWGGLKVRSVAFVYSRCLCRPLAISSFEVGHRACYLFSFRFWSWRWRDCGDCRAQLQPSFSCESWRCIQRWQPDSPNVAATGKSTDAWTKLAPWGPN